MPTESSNTLKLALMAAFNRRQVATIQYLLQSHGAFRFSEALASLPCGQMADVVSLLSYPSRVDVYRRLSYDSRNRLSKAVMQNLSSDKLEGRCGARTSTKFKSRLFATVPYLFNHQAESGSLKRI